MHDTEKEGIGKCKSKTSLILHFLVFNHHFHPNQEIDGSVDYGDRSFFTVSHVV